MITFPRPSNYTGGEINMRQEMIDLIYGKGIYPPRGNWVIFRKSDTSTHSPYWNDERKESIGGPPWEYKDYLIRARQNSYTSGKYQEVRDVMALVENPICTFYLDYRMNIKKEDYILVIKHDGTQDPPSVFTVIAKYDILSVQTPRDQNGRIEYFNVTGKKDTSRGDRTLDNIVIEEIIYGT